MAKPNMNTDNKLGKKMFVICLLISQRKGQFPRITELLPINKKKKKKKRLKIRKKTKGYDPSTGKEIHVS